MKQTDIMAIVTAEDPQDCRSITDLMVPDPSSVLKNATLNSKCQMPNAETAGILQFAFYVLHSGCVLQQPASSLLARAHSHNLFDHLQIRC
jgi:hypothetical protein